MAERPGGRATRKRAGEHSAEPCAARLEFAVIAGNRTVDPITSSVLEDPDDGKVSVSDTRLEGMRDFRVVTVSHAYIMKDAEVIELTERFLKTGSFAEPAQ